MSVGGLAISDPFMCGWNEAWNAEE